jgi:hypothetical protein
MILPTLDQIIRANRRQVEIYGGVFLGEDNMLNSATLEAALTLLTHGVYGKDLTQRWKKKLLI